MALQNLRINPQRLWDALMETAKYRCDTEGRHQAPDAVRRATSKVRDWFKAQCEALGCTVTRRRGRQHVRAAAGQEQRFAADLHGLHLDTQPTGGKFDGVLGVLGALEAMRTLARRGLRNKRAGR